MSTAPTELVKAPTIITPGAETRIAVMPPDQANGNPTMALMRCGPNGNLRSLRVNLPIDKNKGESFGMNAKVGDQWKTVQHITALGYMKLNQVRGVSFVSPETLRTENGRVVPNPYIRREEPGGAVLNVRTRQIGIARAATGTLMVRDITLEFDLRVYFAQDLWSKWTGRKKDPPKGWGKLHETTGSRPADVPDGWIGYPMPAGVTLWVDLGHDDLLAVLGEHINRQKFAERNATTICCRNVLRNFIPVTRVDDSGTAPVIGWVQEDRDLVELAQAAADANVGVMTHDGLAIDVQRETVTDLDKEEIDAALAGDADEDFAGPDEDDATPAQGIEPKAPPAEATKKNDPLAAKRAKLRELHAEVGEKRADERLGGLGINGPLEFGTLEEPLLDEAILSLQQMKSASRNGKKGGAKK